VWSATAPTLCVTIVLYNTHNIVALYSSYGPYLSTSFVSASDCVTNLSTRPPPPEGRG